MTEQEPSQNPADAPGDPLFTHPASPFIRTEAPTPVAHASPPTPTPPAAIFSQRNHHPPHPTGVNLLHVDHLPHPDRVRPVAAGLPDGPGWLGHCGAGQPGCGLAL